MKNIPSDKKYRRYVGMYFKTTNGKRQPGLTSNRYYRIEKLELDESTNRWCFRTNHIIIGARAFKRRVYRGDYIIDNQEELKQLYYLDKIK
jgi:hypothetical protein